MTTSAQWLEGARPRTLPAAVAPVLVGTGAASSSSPVRALLASGKLDRAALTAGP